MAKKKKQSPTDGGPTDITGRLGAAQAVIGQASVQNNVPKSNTTFIHPLIGACVLVAAVLLAFFAGFKNDFLGYDDTYYVTQNPLVMSPTLASLIKLLRVECAYNFHPLTMASYWMNVYFFGKGAASFIITNTALHIFNTLLVFALTLQLTRKNNFIAFFTALLWGVHPLHTESVAWIAERKDVLYSFFFLLSCICYVSFTTSGKTKFWIFSFLLFVLSCLSKGMAVVLPLALVLIDYWLDVQPWTAKRIAQKLPFFLLAFVFGIIAIHVQGGGDLGGLLVKLSPGDESAIHHTLSLWQRLSFGSYGFFVYLFKLIIPINLHNFYAYPLPADYNNIRYLAAPFALIAVLAFSLLQLLRKRKVYWGILFFFFTIVTVLQFLSVGPSILSERYAYIPSFGILFMIVYWLSTYANKTLSTVGLSAAALVFILLTYRQVQTYQNTETLFLNSYQYEPTSDRVNEILSNYYGEHGDYEQAVAYGVTALENGVASWRLYVFMGKAYYFLKDYKKSVEYWARAMQLVPETRKAGAFYDRGLMLCAAGNYGQSINDFDSTFKYDAKNQHDSSFKSSVYYQRALAKRLAKLYPDAVNDFGEAMKLDTVQYKVILKEKAFTELLAQNWPAAQTDYTTLLQLGIVKDTSYGNRACARYNMGDKAGAISDWQDALKVNPNFQDAKNNLAKVATAAPATPKQER